MSSDAIALDSIRALFDGGCPGFELACAVSNPDRPKGRGKKLSPNDVSAWALENGVELLRPEGSPDESDVARMRELGVEMIVVMAYGRMLKKNVLEYGKYPCLNLHASLLPQLRGASPVETAIALGFKSTGVSLMAIEPRMDSGPVCAAAEVAIEPSDGSASLRGKIAAAAARLLAENISSVADGSAKFEPQVRRRGDRRGGGQALECLCGRANEGRRGMRRGRRGLARRRAQNRVRSGRHRVRGDTEAVLKNAFRAGIFCGQFNRSRKGFEEL